MSTRLPWTDPVPDANLLARYLFSEGTGTSVADSSGNSLDGTAFGGMTWFPGLSSPLVGCFDGTDDYVSCGDNLSFVGTPFTFSAWVRVVDFGTYVALVSKYDSFGGATTNQEYDIGISGAGNFRVFMVDRDNGAGSRLHVESQTVLTTGKWYHVAATYDGGADASGIQMFINGVQDAVTIVTDAASFATMRNTSQPFEIGRVGFSTGKDYANVYIGDLRMYGRVLAAREIKSVYKTGINALKQDFTTGLTGRWNFNEGTGTTVADSVGSNDATLNNSMTFAAGELLGPFCGAAVGGTEYASCVSKFAPARAHQDPITAMGWVYFDTVKSTVLFIQVEGGGGGAGNFSAYYNAGVLCLKDNADNSANVRAHQASWTPQAGRWYHVAISVTDNNTSTIYIDGVAYATSQSDATAGWGAQTGNFMGGDSLASGYTLDGKMDDMRIYNAALTQDQVRQVMRATQPPFGVINQIRGGGQ